VSDDFRAAPRRLADRARADVREALTVPRLTQKLSADDEFAAAVYRLVSSFTANEKPARDDAPLLRAIRARRR
jgi:hypothetical protein